VSKLAFLAGVTMLALAAPVGAKTPAAAPAPAAAAVAPDPEAIAALKKMSAYLTSLDSFELTSDATLDVVTVNDQRLQLDGQVHYKVKKPGIWIDFVSDIKSRRYYYDGKNFTIYAPSLGFYASMPAPPTNKEFLKAAYDKFGVSLPLEDLFRWADGDDSDLKALKVGFSVGTATLDGVETDHWAFREGDFDWEVWIDTGDKPLPRKLVIVDRTDPTMPAYTARLKWNVNPQLTDSDFIFTPGKDAIPIKLATVEEAH
jgi:hypothetical protein